MSFMRYGSCRGTRELPHANRFLMFFANPWPLMQLLRDLAYETKGLQPRPYNGHSCTTSPTASGSDRENRHRYPCQAVIADVASAADSNMRGHFASAGLVPLHMLSSLSTAMHGNGAFGSRQAVTSPDHGRIFACVCRRRYWHQAHCAKRPAIERFADRLPRCSSRRTIASFRLQPQTNLDVRGARVVSCFAPKKRFVSAEAFSHGEFSRVTRFGHLSAFYF
jgi:hypothetical protein